MDLTRRAFTLLFLLLLFTLCAVGPAEAGPSELSEADRLFTFAGRLMEEKDYYRAITEFKRFISYFPEDARIPLCRLNIALAYKRGEKVDLAVEHFEKICAEYKGTPISERACFESGAAYFQSGRYEEAEAALSTFLRSFPDSGRLDSGRVLLGWSLVHLWELDRAAEAFSAVNGESPSYPLAQALGTELETPPEIRRKSPVLAGVMSAILPGSGQFYTGRFHEGLTSFVLNGSFIWAVVELFGHGNEAAGLVLGFFETGWYTGGVFGAVNDAHKYNQRARRDFILGLESRYPPPAGD